MSTKSYDEILSNVNETIKTYGMLKDVQRVIVGVSGGADSVTLLHFLYFFASEKNKKFKVEAVHVNHGLRGKEAERDEHFVKKFCKEHGIKLTVKKIDVFKLAESNKIGLEEAGRKARYEIFDMIAKDNSYNAISKIATAHTLSDSCETLIFNLARGTSLKGLCGIPPVRDNIIRPLIGITREDVEEYCRVNNLNYVNDSTNFQRDYTRNKIRLDIIPNLKKINKNFENTLEKSLVFFNQDEKYLNSLAEEKLSTVKLENENEFDAEKIKNLPAAIKDRVIAKIIGGNVKNLVRGRYIELTKSLLEGGLEVNLPNNLKIACKNNILKVKKRNKTEDKSVWEYPFSEKVFLTEIKTNIIIKVEPISEYLKEKNRFCAKNILDFEKIPCGAVIRNRKVGDRFCFSNRNITKTVKKLMNELKIPENIRDKVPLIAHKDEVLWIDGVGVSKGYSSSEGTKKVAIIYKEIN